ncbi:WD repeat-containing protein slp1 [Lodderomyces elongisporus]|uniref:WD repeat-containing protein slp1 n=1 Tax=Lodderomyces elongisporus TaxID=36914 RepID=UPI002923854D|nr:WD repeat-containing protein slp1 [Lodderomyces elongisporus]WLF81558.1 WD repeat-containing protein slp1 [Lodderomyces elongisporus]
MSASTLSPSSSKFVHRPPITDENNDKTDNHYSAKAYDKSQRFVSGPLQAPDPLLSPSKREFLKQMSPNVTKKHRVISNEPISKPPSFVGANTKKESKEVKEVKDLKDLKDVKDLKGVKESKFARPQFPSSFKPTLAQRSKTSIAFPMSMSMASGGNINSSSSNSNAPGTGASTTSVPFTLRRSNSLLTRSNSSLSTDHKSTSLSNLDRFIPSRHNSSTRKLDSSGPAPEPNAAPEKHIEAQTSKIYQHHVAEACGLEMNSRILLYQPQPPERKKPVDLLHSNYKINAKTSLSPLLASARAKKIPSTPERVLDAPGLVDDFYLNLLAWSSYNLLAIGLEDAVYVWNASTGSVGLLCELPEKTLVTSLRWSQDGSYISIGKDDGLVEIWDIEQNTKLRTLNCDNHLTRVASQAWNSHILTSGSRVGNLYHSDVRISSHLVDKNEGCHVSEISGIEYRPDSKQFVTGGNDNLVNIWDVRNSQKPLFAKRNHRAAVKAMSWCPYQMGLLATGGGSTDKTIHFWNTNTGARVNTIETGSQISSLNWGYAAGTGMEIVATHGFPTNSISLFNYPTLQKTGEVVNAHDTRILNGCLSPDNLTLATIAGDENLKFWSLFDMDKSYKRVYDEEAGDDLGDETVKDAKRLKRMMKFR